MKWPRGKYNGRNITGIEVKFVIDLAYWQWLPLWLPDVGGPALAVLSHVLGGLLQMARAALTDLVHNRHGQLADAEAPTLEKALRKLDAAIQIRERRAA